jgi:hypothetical protein
MYMVQIQYHYDDQYYCSFAVLLPNLVHFVVSLSQLSDSQLHTECVSSCRCQRVAMDLLLWWACRADSTALLLWKAGVLMLMLLLR